MFSNPISDCLLFCTVSPAYVSLTTNSSTVVEGYDGLTLTCAVPADGHGNPTTYTYYWTNIASGMSYSHESSTLFLGIYEVDKTIHDGRWLCQAANDIGNSTTDSIKITVQGEK